MINQNGNITKQLKEDFGLSELTGYPRRISEAILPVVEVNQKYSYVIGSLAGQATTTSGTSVILSTKYPNKQLYVTAVAVSNTQDATSDNAQITLSATMNGETIVFFRRRKQTTTATSSFDFIEFNKPLKLDKNTAITFGGTFTAGNCLSDVVVFGYVEDETGR